MPAPDWKHGLGNRIKAYFHANPDEELTLEMVMQKFDVGDSTARNAVRNLVLSGDVESFRIIRRKEKGRAS